MCIVQAGSGFGFSPICQMQRHPTILEITKRCTYKRTRKQFTIDPLAPLNFCFPNQLVMYSEAVALLVTATSHCIWQTKVGQLNATPQNHTSKPVNHKTVLAKIFTHISNRQKKEKQRTDQTFIDTIQERKHRLADKL